MITDIRVGYYRRTQEAQLSQKDRTTRCQLKCCQLHHNGTKIVFKRLSIGQ